MDRWVLSKLTNVKVVASNEGLLDFLTISKNFLRDCTIQSDSQQAERVKFGGFQIPSLLFADDVVLLGSSNRDPLLALGRFVFECEAAGMRISTSKPEAMVLSRKRVDGPI